MNRFLPVFSMHCKFWILLYVACFAQFYIFSHPKTEAEIEQIILTSGYEIKSLNPFRTNGATECNYFLLQSNEKHFFIKTGEKVNIEVENYLKLHAFLKNAILPLNPGSSKKDAVLVLEYLKEPNYGFSIVDQLYTKKISPEEFVILQEEIFEKLKEFYQIPVSNDTSISHMFSIRLEERMQALIADQDKIEISASQLGLKRGLSLRDLLNIPLILSDHKRLKVCENIHEMIESFNRKIELLPNVQKYVLHGDFHAPNIGRDHHGIIKLLDLSDIKYGEDPSWDLGKWLNHVCRLHHVVSKRVFQKPDKNIEIRDEGSVLILKDLSSKIDSMDKIRDHAISTFAQYTNIPEDILRVRAAAAEFVVNISTFKRHLKFFPNITNQLLYCIADSYDQFTKEWYVYITSRPPFTGSTTAPEI